MSKPTTVTEAAMKSYMLIKYGPDLGTTSSVRTPSFAERYREQASSSIETPIEHIQRAAEDEERRDDIINPAATKSR